MNDRFEVHARLVQRDGAVIVRDEVRRAEADDLDAAYAIAQRFTADGFTVWIYHLQRSAGAAPVFRRVDQAR